MKNHSHSSSHLTKTGGGKGKRTFCKKTLVLAVSSALAVIASPSLLNAQSVSGPASNSVIQWQATTADGDRTIHIQYPDGTRYYQYNYFLYGFRLWAPLLLRETLPELDKHLISNDVS